MTSSAAKKRSEELTSGYGLPEDALALLQEEVAYALDLAEASGRISERAATVAWLRGGAGLRGGEPAEEWDDLWVAARDIERGEHRREEER